MSRFLKLKYAKCKQCGMRYKYTKDDNEQIVIVNKDKVIEVKKHGEDGIVEILFSDDFKSHGFYYDFLGVFNFDSEVDCE